MIKSVSKGELEIFRKIIGWPTAKAISRPTDLSDKLYYTPNVQVFGFFGFR